MSDAVATIVSMTLEEHNKAWKVEFRMPSTALSEREVQRGPNETLSIPEVIKEAHKRLTNGLWPLMRAAVDAMPADDKWDRFMKIARSAAGEGDPAEHDA